MAIYRKFRVIKSPPPPHIFHTHTQTRDALGPRNSEGTLYLMYLCCEVTLLFLVVSLFVLDCKMMISSEQLLTGLILIGTL